ncbi:MAG TPA: GGDEF domain-containing protein [Methylothermaceae bacterium]|nr:GGDEF domain-containing protein [Methylothermaceae bacterium]
MTGSDTDFKRWQARSLALAKELDEQQKRQAQNEKILARALIRLTLAYEGRCPATDAQLLQLREILRQGILNTTRLARVDELSEAVLRSSDQESPVPEWQTPLLDFLLECAPGDEERSRIEQLKQQSFSNPEQLKAALAVALAADERGSQWNWLRRWFGARSSEGGNARVLHRHLRQILAEIEIPLELTEEKERLTTLLHQSGSIETVLEGTARLLSAINERLRHEQTEIERFLEQLSGRLQTLESQTHDVGRLFLGGDRLWEDKLSAQVDHLRLQTIEETDLQALKKIVAERLNAIGAHLQALREAEERRNLEAERKIVEMSRRLRELEQESDDLRQRLRLAHQQALHDPLTSLPNRQAVDERIAQEFARWRRFGEPFSMLLWDIDHFKQINDRFGHRAGDKALRIVAQILRDGIRKVDFVGRYGGEEFLMLLPETDSQGALKLAEKLRKAVETCGFNSRGKPVPITISCGISCVQEGDTPQSLFERVDKALYMAKQQGRNRCVRL